MATGGTSWRRKSTLRPVGPRPDQRELEKLIAEKDAKAAAAKSVTMIQCVGSRIPERPYCSRYCCSEAIKNALKLKEADPEKDITILYRDIRTFGLKEDYYKKARS